MRRTRLARKRAAIRGERKIIRVKEESVCLRIFTKMSCRETGITEHVDISVGAKSALLQTPGVCLSVFVRSFVCTFVRSTGRSRVRTVGDINIRSSPRVGHTQQRGRKTRNLDTHSARISFGRDEAISRASERASERKSDRSARGGFAGKNPPTATRADRARAM